MKEQSDIKQRIALIAVFISPLGFYQLSTGNPSGLFYHAKFPNLCFDLSGISAEPECVMSTIFSRIVEFGENRKMEEIRKSLGVK